MTIIFTDGGARGNPGPAAAGALIGEKKFSKYLGEVTNNQAEYQAVILALENCPDNDMLINLDSGLVYNQLIGEYKVKHANMKPLYEKVMSLTPGKNTSFKLIPREENKIADLLVNDELDKR